MAIKGKHKSIDISFTDFIDFVNKSGGSKLTKVRQVKNREEYNPATDFYKALREGIIYIHKKNHSKKELTGILTGLTDTKKIKNYPEAIKGYKKFWGNKKFTWFTPPSKHWKIGDIDININPELGLEYDDKFLVIKLYFKADRITKDKVNQILSLLEHQLRKKVEPEIIFCVLDVKAGKLFQNIAKDSSFIPLLEGEAVCFETIWKAI
ncbi:MAG: hypothetical protein IPI78_18890 [Chitinophagaceae bacterium]|nr:hypothetical protein [Chitinophagaceae bacterium]